MTAKLLSQEELEERLRVIMDTHSTGQGVKALVNIINEQKIAHALEISEGENVKNLAHIQNGMNVEQLKGVFERRLEVLAEQRKENKV